MLVRIGVVALAGMLGVLGSMLITRESHASVGLRRCRERERDLADRACGPSAGGRAKASHRREAARPRRWSSGADRRLGLCHKRGAARAWRQRRAADGAGRASAHGKRWPADRSDRRGRLLRESETRAGGAAPARARAPAPAHGAPRSTAEAGDRHSRESREAPPRPQPARAAAPPAGAVAARTPAADANAAARPAALRLPGCRTC